MMRRKVGKLLGDRRVVGGFLLLIQLAIVMFGVSWASTEYHWLTPALTVLSVVIVIWLVSKCDSPMYKITWMLVIVLLPLFGGLFYLFWGNTPLNRARTQHQYEPNPPDFTNYMRKPATEELAAVHPRHAARTRYIDSLCGMPAWTNTEAHYFRVGEEMFASMCEELEKAEKFIFLEYFIIEEGDVWGRILKILEERVRAGVEVRVLYDGTCTFYRLPYGYPKRMEALGIRCKMFAPLRPLVSTYYNNRDHRKIAVIDGRVGFTGGVNLADEYANLVSVYGVWKDTAVRLEGEAVRSLTLMFLQMWGMDEREPDTDSYGRYLNVPLRPLPGAGGYVLPYADSPLDDERVGECVYLDILNHAERYVRIFTPYLILDETMVMALTFAAKRGVDVELILPHVPDKKFAFALAKGHYRELLDAGVKIYEYTPGFVHAKVFVSDDRKAVVGTINLDYRSLYLHFEDAVYLYDCPCIKDIVADFDATRAQSQIVTHGDLARIPLHTRIAAALLKLVAPLM